MEQGIEVCNSAKVFWVHMQKQHSKLLQNCFAEEGVCQGRKYKVLSPVKQRAIDLENWAAAFQFLPSFFL